MFRAVLISLFITCTTPADTWTVVDDGKVDFDNIQAAVDTGPLSAGNCCVDEGFFHPLLIAMVCEFG